MVPLGVSAVTGGRACYPPKHLKSLTFAPEEPNAESLEAIAEGDAFLASGEPGRFTDAHGMIEAALS